MASKLSSTNDTAEGAVDDAVRNGTDRRRELLDIAAQVFAEKGVAHTTVRDIADRAGILSGSLYHHFQSKNQIVAEVLERGLREAGRRDASVVAASDGPLEAVGQLIYNIVLWAGREPYVARILASDQQYIKDSPDLVQVEQERQTNRILWVDVVQSGIDSGVFDPRIDADVCVRSIFAGTLAAIRWLPPMGKADPAVIGRQLATFYVGGLVHSGLDLDLH